VNAAREQAKALASKTTPGEQLMVAWIVKVQEGDFIGGISAMNDMLEMYPKDKHLLYLAGNWLMESEGSEQARRMMEKALAIDKNFPAALNDLAYVDARDRALTRLWRRWIAMSRCFLRSRIRRTLTENCCVWRGILRDRCNTIVPR